MMARCPLLAVALAVTLAGCTAGTGQRDIEPEFIFRYAENQIEDYPTTQAARYFAEAVEERTGGRIQQIESTKSSIESSTSHIFFILSETT